MKNMTSPSCLFCRIGEGAVPGRIVWQNDNVFVLLNLYPSDVGHVLFIPKEHAEQLHLNRIEVAEDLMRAVHALTPKIVEALSATGYNIGVNSGVDAGQEIFHTHIHVIPRYAGKERGFGKRKVSEEELENVANTLTQALMSKL